MKPTFSSGTQIQSPASAISSPVASSGGQSYDTSPVVRLW